jgi:hypothetical protein
MCLSLSVTVMGHAPSSVTPSSRLDMFMSRHPSPFQTISVTIGNLTCRQNQKPHLWPAPPIHYKLYSDLDLDLTLILDLGLCIRFQLGSLAFCIRGQLGSLGLKQAAVQFKVCGDFQYFCQWLTDTACR